MLAASSQVWVDAPPTLSLEWNAARSPSAAYPAAVMRELASRFEVPDESKRWDSPLFRVICSTEQANGGALAAAHPGSKHAAAVGAAVFSHGTAAASAAPGELHADEVAAYATSSGVAPSGATLDRVRIVASGDGAGGGWSVVHVGSQVTHMSGEQQEAPSESDASSNLAKLSSTGSKAFQLRPAAFLPGGAGPGGVATSAFKRAGAAPVVQRRAVGTSAFKRAQKQAAPSVVAPEEEHGGSVEDDAESVSSCGGAVRSDAGSMTSVPSQGDSSSMAKHEPSAAIPTAQTASVPSAAGSHPAPEAKTPLGHKVSILEAILDTICGSKLAQTASTSKTNTKASHLLHTIDRATLAVSKAATAALPAASLGDELGVPPACVPLKLARRTSPAEIQRMRVQFMSLAAGRVSQDDMTRADSIQGNADMFVQFLNAALARAAV